MGESNQHISREGIARLLDNALPGSEAERVRIHISSCEFCAELFKNLKIQLGLENAETEIGLSGRVMETAQLMHRDMQHDSPSESDILQPGSIIELKPMVIGDTRTASLLAADSQAEPARKIEHLATAYSEEPEALVRLMRDNVLKRNFLQIVTDNPKLYQNALIESNELGCSVITNTSGEADLPNIDIRNLSTARWKIRMPEALFTLEPVDFGPHATRGGSERILETPQGDRLRITLVSESDGIRLQIELLELRGNPDFKSTRLAVTLDDETKLYKLSDRRTVVIQTTETLKKLEIQVHC